MTFMVSSDKDLCSAEPGSFQYYGDQTGDIAGMAFICPCGDCGLEGVLHFSPRPDRASWKWDGNMEHPTLSPSVNAVGFPCKWHGWLKNGEWHSV